MSWNKPRKLIGLMILKLKVLKAFILFFASQLINCMIGLHNVGILHGDYKPDNIMLEKIVNFDEPFHNGKSQGKFYKLDHNN